MGRKYGINSLLLATLGILFFYLSSFGSKGIFNVYFLFGMIFWTISLIQGIKGIKTKEHGVIKYLGIGLISLTVLGYLLLMTLLAISGFGA